MPARKMGRQRPHVNTVLGTVGDASAPVSEAACREAAVYCLGRKVTGVQGTLNVTKCLLLYAPKETRNQLRNVHRRRAKLLLPAYSAVGYRCTATPAYIRAGGMQHRTDAF